MLVRSSPHSNEATANNVLAPTGLFAPGDIVNGTIEGDVNIYGHDSYPLGFDCANPYTWPSGDLPTSFHSTHAKQSPSTFYSLDEFQVSRTGMHANFIICC